MSIAARFLVYAAFFYTCLEGLVINLAYPAVLPYLYKDLALLAVYCLVFWSDLERLFDPSPTVKNLTLPLACFSGVVGLYLMQMGFGSLAGLLALKQRIFYIPLISVGYLFVRSEKDLIHLLRALAIAAIATAGFGIYLHLTGPDGLKELGGRYSAVILTPDPQTAGTAYWRVPGSFTSPGQYGAYLQFNGLVCAALLLSGSVSRLWKSVVGVAVVSIVLALLASGTRAPFALLGASVALLVLLSRRLKGIIAWAFVAYALLAYGFSFLGAGVEDRFASIVNYEHVQRFERTYFGQLFMPELLEKPTGSGLGVATIGTRHVSGHEDVRLVESYLGVLAVEMGLVGLGLFLWVIVSIVCGIARGWRYVERSPAKLLWYALAIYVLLTILILPVSTVIDHAPSNLYFWFSIGVLIKLADLERRRMWSPQLATYHRRVAQVVARPDAVGMPSFVSR